MSTIINKHERNMAGFIHLSTFTKYFIPFGNFIFPLLLWVLNKEKHPFVDANGKQAINFQISVLLYGMVLGVIAIPIILITGWEFIEFANILENNRHEIDFNLSHLPSLGIYGVFLGIICFFGIALFITDVLCSIIATLRANDGLVYKYPLSIKFLK